MRAQSKLQTPPQTDRSDGFRARRQRDQEQHRSGHTAFVRLLLPCGDQLCFFVEILVPPRDSYHMDIRHRKLKPSFEIPNPSLTPLSLLYEASRYEASRWGGDLSNGAPKLGVRGRPVASNVLGTSLRNFERNRALRHPKSQL